MDLPNEKTCMLDMDNITEIRERCRSLVQHGVMGELHSQDQFIRYRQRCPSTAQECSHIAWIDALFMVAGTIFRHVMQLVLTTK